MSKSKCCCGKVKKAWSGLTEVTWPRKTSSSFRSH